jgi:hypothetical protein
VPVGPVGGAGRRRHCALENVAEAGEAGSPFQAIPLLPLLHYGIRATYLNAISISDGPVHSPISLLTGIAFGSTLYRPALPLTAKAA